MKRFHMPPAVRISLGLSMFTLMLLMGAELLGIIPDPQKTVLDMRKKVCESLAVYASLAVNDGDLAAVETTMTVLKHRNADILSSALRRADGTVLATVGDHQRYWSDVKNDLSTSTNVQVPIFKGNIRWGTFEVCFSSKQAHGLMGIWERPIVQLIILILPVSFMGFLFLMKKTLRHLDPSAVVPPRVKAALDSLVESVVLLDNRERIVLANSAFEKNFGATGRSMMGQKVSDFDWKVPDSQSRAQAFPWQQAMLEGDHRRAVPLSLNSPAGDPRTYMVNGAPIVDGQGNLRGALATFDDVTKIEAQNTQLQKMLTALEKSRDEVHRQNQALQILATQDPLTRCLNRRAFYERFESEYNRAQRYGNDLCCVMIDIDHFKSINDNYGHPVGDKVLQMVSSTIQDVLRDSDILCRYGGEEFCIILPECGIAGAHQTAERIRSAVADETYAGVHLTISLGISSFGSHPSNPSDLLSQADKALYKAKNSGRNRVVCFKEGMDTLAEGATGRDESAASDTPKANLHIPHHVVQALMLALEHRDIPTAEHSRQVGDLCVAAAQGLMSINECAVLEIAGQLHDIGKLGVPDAILLKPGPLTQAEWKILHGHERRSVDVIASMFASPELVDIVNYHSAWFDGSSPQDPSWPKGTDIPLGARILGIADAFNSMISKRPYRRAFSYEKAFNELRRCAGSQFDPDLVDHFIEVIRGRDTSRRKEDAPIPNSVKLEIGREVEKLFVAVNKSSSGSFSLSVEQLITKSIKYGLTQIADVALEIEKAVAEKRDQMEIIQLASELMQLYRANKGLTVDTDKDQYGGLAN